MQRSCRPGPSLHGRASFTPGPSQKGGTTFIAGSSSHGRDQFRPPPPMQCPFSSPAFPNMGRATSAHHHPFRVVGACGLGSMGYRGPHHPTTTTTLPKVQASDFPGAMLTPPPVIPMPGQPVNMNFHVRNWRKRTHTQTHTHIYTHAHTHTGTPTYTRTRIHTYMHTYVRAYMHAQTAADIVSQLLQRMSCHAYCNRLGEQHFLLIWFGGCQLFHLRCAIRLRLAK